MTMQWIFLVVVYIALVAAAAARKTHSEVYTSYSYPFENLHHNPEPYFVSFNRIDDFYGVTDRLDMNSEHKPINKRALSVLSRWRPFGNLGVRVNSIHKTPSRGTMKVSLPGKDFVSAETRGSTRPLGQPLRWGRKR